MTNKKFLKNYYLDNKVYEVYTDINSSKNIKIEYNGDHFIIKHCNHISMEEYEKYDLDKLLKKQLNKNIIILSFKPENHWISIFGKKVWLKWNYLYRNINQFYFSEDENELIISCSIKYQNDEKLRKKIFLNVLSRILENYIRNFQTKMSNQMNVQNTSNIKIVNVLNYWGEHKFSKNKSMWIRYNVKLIALEKELINSVITHELLHHIYKKHTKLFYEQGDYYYRNFSKFQNALNNIKVLLKAN
ncbi:YgjP-like metallopeptidase domain-containing protein [Mycoplasmopsis lipofaciens]|uniref:YgjP-like metallopeptidase domain-containing protein n=1 Tax=Mycoplasmopsis lipofaciens TaxID=114884 RepID=UPI000486B2A1|nr:YgjP-like metallopeptidase domain-containing protein [Mycoplasmopsis lipofaciens]